MSSTAPSDPVQGTLAVGKKKNNKKKKSNAVKTQANGGAAKPSESEVEKTTEPDAVDGDEDPEELATSGTVRSAITSGGIISPQHTLNGKQATPREEFLSSAEQGEEALTNGHSKAANGNAKAAEAPSSPTQSESAPRTRAIENSEGGVESVGSDSTDASSRLEAMSQDREALRLEVEQLRKQLEVIQEQHVEELTTVKAELEESESAKEQAEDQYSTLLGRINTIKASLGDRMKADKAALEEANERNEELEAQNESLKERSEAQEKEISRLKQEAQETSKELSSLRNRNTLSQQNWVGEREDLVQQLKHSKEEAEAAKEAMGDWEVLAMEERSIREGLAERVAELEDHLSVQKESYERAASERDSQSQAVDGLQRALAEIQEARKKELREMVERTESQLDALNKLVQQSESRATDAEAAKAALDKELERAAPFEKEVKEKNLLIGKLRHEAIVLNDHLTKALRFLKKAKPEDNIDRQIVTNHFLHFLALDRSDPKKFQILQLIASLLNWTEEQREQAGLARPGGTSSSSLRLPLSPFHRTPSTPSLNQEFFPETPSAANKESLAELWQGFLERQAEEGSTIGGSQAGSRSASVSSAALARPDAKS